MRVLLPGCSTNCWFRDTLNCTFRINSCRKLPIAFFLLRLRPFGTIDYNRRFRPPMRRRSGPCVSGQREFGKAKPQPKPCLQCVLAGGGPPPRPRPEPAGGVVHLLRDDKFPRLRAV